MATLKQRLHRKNSSGTYDIVHLETSASLVLMDSGTTVEAKIASMDTTIAGKAPSSHYHSADNITSGILAPERGGTGSTGCITGAGANAIMKKASDGNNMWYLNTGNGALFATAANGAPKFGTLPVAQGGTGATTAAAARTNLGITLANLGAAPASHTHAASDVTSGTFDAARIPSLAASKITSGTLSVARGGTGKASWTANRLMYPSASTTLAQLAFPSVAGSVLRQGTSGAPYWTSLADLKTALGISDSSNAKIKYYINDDSYDSYDEATIECGFYPVCIISNTSSDPLPAIGFRGSNKAYYLNQTGNTTFNKAYAEVEWNDTSIYISRTTCCIILGY